MTIYRRPLSRLLDRTGPAGEMLGQSRSLRLISPDPASKKASHKRAIHHNMLLLVSHYGKVEAMVRIDDLFDADGNFFQDDRS